MEQNGFASLAVLQMPPSSRLLPSSCCPDKDLVVVISRLGSKDRVSLWKMQGSKKWEVDIHLEGGHNEEIVDLAWSPDGQTIVLVHDPPRITLHSIQDGREERNLPISHVITEGVQLTGVWWFMEEKSPKVGSIPDIFKRGDDITGSAHSILKMLPLLDAVKDDTQVLTNTGLFAFPGKQAKSSKSDMPEVIASWPSLPSDPLAASILSPARAGEQDNRPGEEHDEIDDTNVDSILAVSDSAGRIHSYLDGSYPLGIISIESHSTTSSLCKGSKTSTLMAHQRKKTGESSVTPLLPTFIRFPLLETRVPRALARISTSVRELLWYIMRVMDDLHVTWFGSSTQAGARELGEKWVQGLAALQVDQPGGNKLSWSILDLVHLLVSGRSSDAVSDFIGSGEQMSERGLQKWESTVIEALVKMRDFSEERVAPACQRLHLMLEELLGWSQLPQLYDPLDLRKNEIEECLEMTGRAIVVASWLPAVARRELSHFKEFMKWLRYEITNANATSDAHSLLQPRHDILEVDSYLMSGLVNSQIDKWFKRGVPHFSPQDLGAPEENQHLTAVMERARRALRDPTQTALQHRVVQKDHYRVDKNLYALVQNLAKRCETIFLRAASATARSAEVCREGAGSPASTPVENPNLTYVIRERSVADKEMTNHFIHHLAIHVPSPEYRTCLFLIRLRYGHEAPGSLIDLGMAILECRLREGDGVVDFDLLDAEFFDDESLVIVYRAQGLRGAVPAAARLPCDRANFDRKTLGPTYIATVTYSDLGYQASPAAGYVREPSREELIVDAFQRWKNGQVGNELIICVYIKLPSAVLTGGPSSLVYAQLKPVLMPIKRSRALTACREGEVYLAVNGRVGRRVACVLDTEGLVLETLDLEGETGEESE
ncbi:hypothetical protein EW146_g3736 [Bondarzewia mesenterica]|uniref:Anaphase-promoting complex subunit 4 n=1 Tax=Bondarzewia mesenterica TaxID=1095465 RepID=A0A4S4LYI1_9AGAM|nr:hypothetical protein EW146_g3736 [Bondarzewia mesenterica]